MKSSTLLSVKSLLLLQVDAYCCLLARFFASCIPYTIIISIESLNHSIARNPLPSSALLFILYVSLCIYLLSRCHILRQSKCAIRQTTREQQRGRRYHQIHKSRRMYLRKVTINHINNKGGNRKEGDGSFPRSLKKVDCNIHVLTYIRTYRNHRDLAYISLINQ